MADRNRSWLYGLAALLVLALVATAVLRRGRGGTTGANQPVRIGSVLVLTGDYKSLGEQIRDGQVIAAEQFNAAPGRRTRIELVFHDSQGDKDLALEKVKALHADGVRFIGEIFGSGPALNSLPFIEQNGMLLLSGVDTGPDLTAPPRRRFFRIIPSDVVAARQLSQWSIDRGEKQAAIVYLNDTWGSALKQELERSFAAAGGTIVTTQEVAQGQDVFQPVVAALASRSPQVVFLFIHPREAALLVVEAKERKLAARFAGTDNLTGNELTELGGAAVEGVGYVVPAAPQASPAREAMLQGYRAKFGADKEPPLFTVMGYDAIQVLAGAIEAAEGDVERAVTILEQTKHDGASGPIGFDASHDVTVGPYQRLVYRPVSGQMKATADQP